MKPKTDVKHQFLDIRFFDCVPDLPEFWRRYLMDHDWHESITVAPLQRNLPKVLKPQRTSDE